MESDLPIKKLRHKNCLKVMIKATNISADDYKQGFEIIYGSLFNREKLHLNNPVLKMKTLKEIPWKILNLSFIPRKVTAKN